MKRTPKAPASLDLAATPPREIRERGKPRRRKLPSTPNPAVQKAWILAEAKRLDAGWE